VEAKKRSGQRTDLVSTLTPGGFGKAREKVAKMVGANLYYVTDAKKIEHDALELIEQVKQGKLGFPKLTAWPHLVLIHSCA
jgi:hypothetical protein